MKLLGLIGGMNWESTIEYYKTLNQLVNERLGGNHSAKVIIYSVDFEEILSLEVENRWDLIKEKMIDISVSLEKAGAQGIAICSNTMHLIAEDLQSRINIPIINVIDATAEEIQKNKIKSIGLLGTKFTMEGDFYKKRLENKYGLKVLVPDREDIETINDIIYTELAHGKINLDSKKEIKRIVEKLVIGGAEGVILGCTELPMIIDPNDTDLPLFDTLEIHMNKAMEFSLKD
ncbi:MAG: aspartate/glutamate racemase family protein [Candidatus Methanofastidiosa archaeon]|nr:aspartate/glutamate racemase family protein [Candidatus Methanofastidiosa archaeon]